MSISSLIEKWDNIAFLNYNLIAWFLFLARYRRNRKHLLLNTRLRNLHKGDRCFIILNGPSVRNFDLSKLANEYVIATNYFYKTDFCDIVRPEYYCIADSSFFNNSDSEDNVNNLLKKCSYSKFIFNIKFLSRFKKVISENVHVAYSKHMPNLFKIRSNLCGLSSGFISVSLFSMNAAIFMGFKNIYLLGYDFEPGILSHFYRDTNTEKIIKARQRKETEKDNVCGKYWQYSQAQYQNYYLSNYARRVGINIYNCNPESHVRSFPFVDYNDLF